MKAKITSFETLGTLDGPGVRYLIFFSSCPLRCVYCHNPESWDDNNAKEYSKEELLSKIIRYKSYFKNKGGVTLTGGEPLLQAEFLNEFFPLLKEEGINIALDTSGVVFNEEVKKMLSYVDLVLLDIKFTTNELYEKYTLGKLEDALKFLDYLEEIKKDVWIRSVIIPKINDNKESIISLKKLLSKYSIIKKIELLPFKKLCLSKYENLNIPFPLKDTEEMDEERLNELKKLL